MPVAFGSYSSYQGRIGLCLAGFYPVINQPGFVTSEFYLYPLCGYLWCLCSKSEEHGQKFVCKQQEPSKKRGYILCYIL